MCVYVSTFSPKTSYSRGLGLESPSDDHLISLRVSLIYFSLCRQMMLKYVTAVLYAFFAFHHSQTSCHSTLYNLCSLQSVIKQPKNTIPVPRNLLKTWVQKLKNLENNYNKSTYDEVCMAAMLVLTVGNWKYKDDIPPMIMFLGYLVKKLLWETHIHR